MTIVDAAPAVFAEPRERVKRSWVSLLFSAHIGLWMAFLAPVQLLLPRQVADVIQLDQQFHLSKESVLGWITALGALVAIVVNPFAGFYSDRTCVTFGGRSFGRRHVWTLGGTALAALSLTLLSAQETVIGMAVCWAVTQVGINMILAALTAAVPDRVPVTQRGVVSGWVSMTQALGLIVGIGILSTIGTGYGGGYQVVAIALVVFVVPFALLTPDERPSTPVTASRRLVDLVTGLWISPRRNPDFAWAWGARFFIGLGNALGTLYLLYFLTDQIKLANPEGGLLIATMAYTVGLVSTAVLGGWLSDRIGRRKIFVIWSGVVMAAAALLLGLWPTWPTTLVAAVLLGAGYGVYLAVDTALVTQVLPAAADRAKDLGVINIAVAAPHILGPVISAPVVVSLGGYPTLYSLTALVTLLGGAMVVKIRAVP